MEISANQRAAYGPRDHLAARPFLEVWYRVWGTRTSAVGHGIEAASGNDVIKPEMTSSNRKCYHGNRDEPEMEKKSRDTLMDRFKLFIEFMASVHCLGIPVVLLLVDRR